MVEASKTWKVTLAVVGGLIVLACGGGSTVSGGESGTTVAGAPGVDGKVKAGFADVTVTKCAMSDNQFSGPEAVLKITNGSSKASNYSVQVAFVSPDGATQIDTGAVFVSSLAPGQSTEDRAVSLKSDSREKAKAGFSCKVLDVTRFAST